MAQTKTRASATRSGSTGKSRTRSQGKSSSSSKSSSSKAGRSSKATKPRNSAKRSTQSKSSSNAAGRMDTTRHAVEDKAKGAGRAVGSAVSKAKVPLVAGGAALAGAAGGLALGARQMRRHRRIGMTMPRRPQVKVNSRDIAKAAKEVGSFGAQVGHLASELQQARESNGGAEKHRSPVEVVLQGLTARR